MYRRKITDRLVAWKRAKHGAGAVLIEGAPRTGKSTTALAFAREHYRDHLVIDLKNESLGFKMALAACPVDVGGFYDAVFDFKGVRVKRGSAIVFNDVQAFPPVREAVDAIVADGRCDCIETGTCALRAPHARRSFAPGQETVLTLLPMDFEEFLWARGIDNVMPVVRTLYDTGRPLGPALHARVTLWFNQYMAVGGMPEAVRSFLGAGVYEDADRAKRNVLEQWRLARSNCGYLVRDIVERTAESVPDQLYRGAEYFNCSNVGRQPPSGTCVKSLAYLVSAGMVNSCTSFSSAHPMPGAHLGASKPCMYVSDTGLLLSQIGDAKIGNPESGGQGVVVANELLGTIPFLVRNAVAQMLAANGYRLYRQTFRLRGVSGPHTRYTLDFIPTTQDGIMPVVVRTNNRAPRAVFRTFESCSEIPCVRKVVLWSRDVMDCGAFVCMPYYMASCM